MHTELHLVVCKHDFMITLFVENCNDISQNFYDSVVNNLQLHRLSCSCGHSSCLSIHGYYYRTAKLPAGDIRLKICRVKCSECGKTHALLLSSMVPYSQIRLIDQQRICAGYEAGSRSSDICDDNLSIDENNIKSVIRNYRQCWKEKLISLKISLSPLGELVRSCFLLYSAQFMQIHRGTNKLFPCTT